MPVFIFPPPAGNPLVRILAGIVVLAVIIGLGMVMLPVVLGILGFCFVAGLLYWAYLKLTGQLTSSSRMEETIRETMQRAEAESRERYAYGEHRTVRVEAIETSDKKRWKMNDVEDIEETPRKEN